MAIRSVLLVRLVILAPPLALRVMLIVTRVPPLIMLQVEL
jgi:hypothetical protein